mmetsp:Transcript_49038/g.120174  ORF Transcript_49038/g.120174 Transcript_49038/m.120174 type:complete len:222 (+) Transcript_49038:425-1090(+)
MPWHRPHARESNGTMAGPAVSMKPSPQKWPPLKPSRIQQNGQSQKHWLLLFEKRGPWSASFHADAATSRPPPSCPFRFVPRPATWNSSLLMHSTPSLGPGPSENGLARGHELITLPRGHKYGLQPWCERSLPLVLHTQPPTPGPPGIESGGQPHLPRQPGNWPRLAVDSVQQLPVSQHQQPKSEMVSMRPHTFAPAFVPFLFAHSPTPLFGYSAFSPGHTQ